MDAIKLKPCPFCNGKARVSFRDMKFYGQNYNGEKKIKLGAQVICQKCHARGTLYSRVAIIPNEEKEAKGWLAESAINAWNRRVE